MTIRSISYGGGVQSTALLCLAAQGAIDFDLVLFSNVGDDSEHPDTLAYVNTIARPFCDMVGIEFIELRKRPKGSERTLYQLLTTETSRSIDIPMRAAGNGHPGHRQCTKAFKALRIGAELKRRGATADDPAVTALGISLDEFHRARTDSRIAWQRLAYPLIDLRLDRSACVEIIERAGLSVPPKSSCWFCPFHDLTYWRRLERDHPALFAKSVALERQLSDRHIALGRDPIFLTRTLRPLAELVEGPQQGELFDEAASCDVAGYCAA